MPKRRFMKALSSAAPYRTYLKKTNIEDEDEDENEYKVVNIPLLRIRRRPRSRTRYLTPVASVCTRS
jgi:hypothetical protein